MTAILTTASAIDAMAQELRKFDLENSVYGGKELSSLYPYSLSSWACRQTDDILYYKPDYTLTAYHVDGSETDISSYNELSDLLSGGYVRILAAETAEDLWITDGADIVKLNVKSGAKTVKIAGPYDDVEIANNTGWVSYT